MYEIINTYVCKDGRERAYCYDENGKRKVISYPRVLVENKLGRKLLPDEDIHHIDGDRLNNNIDNLQVKMHGEHQREHSQKYFDKTVKCEIYGKEFVWDKKKQCRYFIDLHRGKNRVISCSKKCSAYAGLAK